MTLYRAQLKMAVAGGSVPRPYRFSYVWFLEAESPVQAASRGVQLWNEALKPAHNDYAFCYEVYASDLLPDTAAFSTEAVLPGDQRGTLGVAAAGEFYNPNMALRVDLLVAGGYASRKWHRLPLFEGWVASGGESFSVSGVESAVAAAYADAIALPFIRDESGNGFSGVSLRGIRVKRLGKFAFSDIPTPPSFG